MLESAETMEDRCWDHAPLAIVMTAEPQFMECEREAANAAVARWQGVYSAALRQCRAGRAGGAAAGCCFDRVTDDFKELDLELQRCNVECGLPAMAIPAPRCSPVVVSPKRGGRSRAHTAEVAEVLTRCQADRQQVVRCGGLATFVERRYCEGVCLATDAAFDAAVDSCVREAARSSAVASCGPGLPDVLRPICDEWCRFRLAGPPVRVEMPRPRSGP